MKRRSKAAGKPVKARRRKAVPLKRRNAPKAVRRRGSVVAGQETEVSRLTRELDEALARQTATSDILRVISQSPTDVRPVLDRIVLTAARLIRCHLAFVLLCDGATFWSAAIASPEGPVANARPTKSPVDPGANFPSRAILAKEMLHLPDFSLIEIPEHERHIHEVFGVNSALYLPLLREGECIGLLTLVGKRPNIFGPSEIAQAESFRDQALIAIENTQLFGELRESLQQQTATSDVLKVISRSTFDLQAVLDTLVASAVRLCRAERSAIRLVRDGLYHNVANYGFSPEHKARMERETTAPGPGSIGGRIAITGKSVHLIDSQADSDPGVASRSRSGNIRTMLGVPLLREGILIGFLLLQRTVVQAFTDKEIRLAETFADQAVIAIENVRLFEAEQQRTAELAESLQQQTATSEVLRVISSSPGDLEPVFTSILDNTTRICEANFGTLFLREGEALRVAAHHGSLTKAWDKQWRVGTLLQPDAELQAFQTLQTRAPTQVADLSKAPSYLARNPKAINSVEVGGIRTMLTMPMLKDGEAIGVITIFRTEVREFTDKQIALVTNFAAQAVIAIENTRLLSELRESLEQQTATAEVLKVISSSPGDLQPVFQAMLESATRVCQAGRGTLYLREKDGFRVAAFHNMTAAYAAARQNETVLRPPAGTPLGDVAATKQVAHYTDLRTAQTYIDRHPFIVAAVELGNSRTAICVPMLKDGELIGAITIARTEVQPFTEKQIVMLQNFAAQAVIAIENTRLLSELRESLEQQTATAEVLGVINASRGDLQPVFEAMVDKARRLCEADSGHLALPVGDDYRSVAVSAMLPEMEVLIRSVSYAPGRGTAVGRALAERRPVQISDIGADNEHIVRSAADQGFIRTILGVPLLREGEAIGAFGLSRRRVEPFSERQIALVQNFAAQAVIAIENTRLLSELRESLEQQTATSEVLSVISASPGELTPVFQAMLENAVRICDSKFGTLFRYDDGTFEAVALFGTPPALTEFHQKRGRFRPAVGAGLERMARTKDVVHIADESAESTPSVSARLAGARSVIVVPMLKDDELIGAISIYRGEVRPFTEKQIALVTNFAAQAVIAVENTRLLSELRESLEQQTATADVLKVISRSPGDLDPVFDSILISATRICEASFANLVLFDGQQCRMPAMYNAPKAFEELIRRRAVYPTGAVMGRILATKQPLHSADLNAEEAFQNSNLVKLGGARSTLGVPMFKDNEVIGAVHIYRQEVRPFTDKQLKILQNFAAQAVIAIENARLLSELRESLQQQTATADVLKVISRSTFDLRTVLDTLVESAARLCEAEMASINRQRGEAYRQVASYGQSRELQAYMDDHPIAAGQGSVVGRTVMAGKTVHIHDVMADPDYKMTGAAKVGGAHTMLGVPLLREGTPIGVIVLQRKTVRPFTEKQIELVSTFADQAVIAIENVRLFEAEQQRTAELSEALEQQAATSEVLNVISRSKFDLQPILQSVVDTAARLCRADTAVIFKLDQGLYRFAAGYCVDPRYMEIEMATPITPGPGTVVGRAAMQREAVRIVDAMQDPLYEKKGDAEVAQVRSMIGVPLMREGEPIGVIALARQRVEPFLDREIELVSTFADQAAIAIENVRLFESVEARTRELAASLEDLRTAQDRLVQTEKLASLGQLTAGIAHEIKNPLNFVNNFSSVSVELIDELREALSDAPLDAKLRAEIEEIADMLKGNLDKVVQHGKRADSIVKNMLLHSREGSGERRPVDVNALVEESLNLAFHGARAERQGFNIAIERSFDPAAGEVDLFPQEVTRVLLNLISNGFYAATKRKAQSEDGSYEPVLAAATKNLGERVEIRIRDNGTGIPPEVKEKMFNPFFTTKPAGEGTGLGLSISHDIIVKQHAGSIAVDTEPGEFTEFRIILPRAGASLAKSGERA
ncbi:MAG: GAF domain-containing protein [Xanthobacteraceae bacterium]